MGQQIIQVDSFAEQPYSGNPAAVCVMTGPAPEKWMRAVALEMNLSETAFLYPDGEQYQLRWFTPEVEVDLCGHATLASAHVLFEEGRVPPNGQARFMTKSGLLTAVKDDDRITLDFPAIPSEPCRPDSALLEALGVSAVRAVEGRQHVLIEVDTEETVRKATPNFSSLGTIEPRGVILTSQASMPGYDIVSRFFAPGLAINEDPVTGFAHCCLGPYWSGRLNRKDLVAFQASARGGTVYLTVGDERINLGGKAVTVFRGELTEDASRH
jgi:PhzF family phenazine biosynthesis protein